MKKRIIAIISIVVSIVAVIGIYLYSVNYGSNFEIDFLDVGQADAILVECDGEYMMVDGGNVDDSSFIYSYLEEREITNLKYMINTHPDEDHVGGLAGALNYATAETVYCPVTEWSTKAFNSFKKYVEKQGKTITVPKVNDVFYLGSAKVQVLAVNTYDDEINNQSIVLMITYKNNKFLLTGDAEYDVEQYLVDNNVDIKADLLKVGHHGSSSSTSYNFLNKVKPSIAIISVGLNNSYNHPNAKVVEKLENVGSKIYRTDEDGTITCKSNGTNISCEVENDKANN